MARLPVQGGDNGTWGTILNDFLEVSLNGDGTLQSSALQQAGALISGTAALGDLSGSYPNPTVAKINGVSISNAPSSGQILGATGTTTAAWTTPSYASQLGPTGDTTGARDTLAIQTLLNAASPG
ncbi:MAG TPA: hypothetical protein VGS28_00930, partial [Candidatus Saccharimonadales bacterium]|nr:hypothetical protein [Candidatus Saccharimonadales bacterium]